MKRQLFIIVFMMLGLMGFGQKPHVLNLTNFDNKKVHFGFSLGMNVQDFRLSHWAPIGRNPQFQDASWDNVDGGQVTMTDTVRSDIATLNPGLTVGVVSNFRLGEYFDLRILPGLSFGERRLVYTKNGNYLPVYDIYGGTTDIKYVSIKSTYIDVPVLVKYKSTRLNNQRPYIIGGFAYRLDISKTGEDDLLQPKRGTYFLEAGVGLDSYLRFFRFSTEFKVSIGLNNLVGDQPKEQRTYYSDAIKSLYSHIFTLSFHFE